MRRLLVVASSAALFACTAPMGTPGALDGVWTLQAAQSPLDPRTLKLTQHGGTVDGSGDAMGVDAPMRLSVSGSIAGSSVILSFEFTNGSELVGEYTAQFDPQGRLVGNVVFHDGLAVSHPLTYTRK